MKKSLLLSIVFVLILVVVIVGATFAFFNGTFNANNNLNIESSTMNIIYTKGNSFNETLVMSSSRNSGSKTEINVRASNESVRPKINLYMNINSIDSALASEGFIWEVCAERSGDNTVCEDGNFLGYNDTNNNVIPIFSNYELNTTNTKFTVYLWLDGSKVDDSIENSFFDGYISASSENFTARFN